MNNNFLKNKIILITGGTGSFGQGFVKYLLDHTAAKKIIVFSRDEFKQYNMAKELGDDPRLRFFIGDVRDLPRLQRAFHGVDIVVHAAALKQVPTLEYNPFEAVKTNILGSQNVIEAAIDQKVAQALLISTDKAAQPINLYGSTKLCAEKLFISGNVYTDRQTRFSCVRYGNVMGSRGSIIEFLLKNKSTTVHITHEEMTRFWINLDQSFELVLFALRNMVGGEVFVPKMPSMKLIDLFEALAPQAKKKIIGIRPGEKLHEVLVTKEEARHTLSLGDYFVILPTSQEVFGKDHFKSLRARGKAVPAGFVFASDTNERWLSKNDFYELIGRQLEKTSVKKTVKK